MHSLTSKWQVPSATPSRSHVGIAVAADHAAVHVGGGHAAEHGTAVRPDHPAAEHLGPTGPHRREEKCRREDPAHHRKVRTRRERPVKRLTGEAPWQFAPPPRQPHKAAGLRAAACEPYPRRVPSPRDLLRTIRDELRQLFLERDELIDGALVGLLAGQHVLVIGPPGTAKSMLADEVCRRIEGAQLLPVAADALHHARGAVRRRQPAGARARRLPARHHPQAARGAHRLPRRGLQGELVDPQHHPDGDERAPLPQRARGDDGAAAHARSAPPTSCPRTTSCRRSTTASCCASWSTTSARTSAS